MKLSAIVTALMMLALTAAAALAADGTLTLASQAKVNGSKVTLLDLVAPGADLKAGVKKRLAAQTVTAAPSLGRRAKVTGARLRVLIRQARLPKNLSVLLPAEVEISRASRRVTALDLIESYRQALIERLGPQAKDADIHDVSASRDLVVPAGRMQTRVNFVTGRLSGRVPANVEVLVEGRKMAQTRVTGRVDIYGMVVVASRALPRRHVIQPDDIEVVRTKLSEINGDIASDPEDLVGLRTRTPLAANDPLILTRLERAPLIRRGEVVTMICTGKGLRVTAKGRAEQTGFKGGRIRLVNLASKRQVYGTVLDSGTVRVQF
ncbi:MAG: flagellar basal body P-ring formation chaperone FlgA [Desulfarculaceae bacterium]